MTDFLTRPDWMDDADCAEVGPEPWFPDGKGQQAHAAKKICAGCSVRFECLEWSVELDIIEGVWGGLSERERRPLRVARKSRNAAATSNVSSKSWENEAGPKDASHNIPRSLTHSIDLETEGALMEGTRTAATSPADQRRAS